MKKRLLGLFLALTLLVTAFSTTAYAEDDTSSGKDETASEEEETASADFTEGNDFGTAYTIESGKTYTIQNAKYGEYEYLTFDMQKDGYINIYCEDININRSSSSFILYDNNQAVIDDVDVVSISGGENCTLRIGLAKGKYYLRVSPGNDRIIVSPEIVYTDYAEKEPNDTKNTATKLELNAYYKTSVNKTIINFSYLSSYNSDVYSFDAVKGKLYEIRIKNFDIIKPRVSVREESGGYLVQWGNNNYTERGEYYYARFTAPYTGTLYVVSSGVEAAGWYDVGVFDVPELTADNTKIVIEDQTYTGDTIEPPVKVLYNGKELKDTEYSKSFNNNKNVGVATCTITGLYPYAGTVTGSFKIVEKGEEAGNDEEPTETGNNKNVLSINEEKNEAVVYDPISTGGKSTVNLQVTKSGKVYRMYDGREHFYTKVDDERSFLLKNYFKEEVQDGFEVISADEEGAIPVFRFYNKNNGGMHFFTVNEKEAKWLKEQGWDYEGIAFYAYENGSGKGTPQYRLLNPNSLNGEHNWTSSKEERDWLVKQGWKDEGFSWNIK